MSGIVIGTSGTGKARKPATLLARFANRHGLIAGATGTGKTVTLQAMAEGFSAMGVPVFLADAKGDLAGIAAPGTAKPAFVKRLEGMGLPADGWSACPALFWDVFGQQGHPVRVPVSEIGPLLFARLLNLNEVQTGVLTIAFKLADDEGMLLLDLKDLRAMLAHVAERAKELTTEYGIVSPQSVGAIQRGLLTLEQEGAAGFLGEPGLDLADLMRLDRDGRGVVSVLAAEALLNRPRLYGTFLVWLLAELFETLPEAGDLDRPKLVLFFDEAHLLFDDAPEALTDKIEQVVRLIRSKGVGVYFVTQNPLDIPERVLGQLGNRVQHALRAFTPRDQRAVRAAAETFRPNPRLNTADAIMELEVGEALVSFLDAKGAPSVVERTLIRPPASRVGPLTPAERASLMRASPVAGVYDKPIDRHSAYEMLRRREESAASAEEEMPAHSGGYRRPDPFQPPEPSPGPWEAPRPSRKRTAARQPASVAEEIVGAMAKEFGTQVGRKLVRGILGSFLRR